MECRWMTLLSIVVAVAGCTEKGRDSDVAANSVVSAPTFTREAGPAAPTTEPAAPPVEDTAQVAEPEASAAPEPEEPPAPPEVALPDVEVKNIGMHIGGGPNDAKTKAPIRQAVTSHYDQLRACYAKVVEPAREVTFGVDIRIDRKGGKAKITNPRSGFKGDDATQCMLAVFEEVEFPHPPSRAPTMVSYSLRFTRK